MVWIGEQLTAAGAALALIGGIVMVHELGHFFMARLFGVGVHVVSFGFGQRLFGVVRGETDYRVSAFPLGGYVLMAGADPFGEEDVDAAVPPHLNLMRKPIWQRLLIALAGPAVNVLLPLFLFTCLYMYGIEETGPEVGHVLERSAAAEAGVQPGDVIRAVDGRPVLTWQHWLDGLEASDGVVSVTLERGGASREVTLSAPNAFGGITGLSARSTYLGVEPFLFAPVVGVDDTLSPAGRVGLRSGDRITAVDGVAVDTWPALQSALNGAAHELVWTTVDGAQESGRIVADPAWTPLPEGAWKNPWGVVPDMLIASGVSGASEEAGLKVGDRLLTVDGVPIVSFEWFIGRVAQSRRGDQMTPLNVVVVRDGERLERTLTARLTLVKGEESKRPVVGLMRRAAEISWASQVRQPKPFLEALGDSAEIVTTIARRTFALIFHMSTGDESVGDNLSGPVGIFRVASAAWAAGMEVYLGTVAMISLSVGLLNLLPVPIFDGGQILFYLVEGVRGRPLPVIWRERIQMVSVLAVMVLFVYVTFSDVFLKPL